MKEMEVPPVPVTPLGIDLLCHVVAWMLTEQGKGWWPMAEGLAAEMTRPRSSVEAIHEPLLDEWEPVFRALAKYVYLVASSDYQESMKGFHSYASCLELVAQMGWQMHQSFITANDIRLTMKQINWRKEVGLAIVPEFPEEELTDE